MSSPDYEYSRKKAVMSSPIVHCLYGEVGSSVFYSQVVERLDWANSHGHNVWLAALVPIGHLLRRQPRRVLLRSRNELERVLPGRSKWLLTLPSRLQTARLDCRILSRWLRKKFNGLSTIILHCRGLNMAYRALDVRHYIPGAKVIFDCRGNVPAEYVYTQQQRGFSVSDKDRHSRWLFAMEKRAAQESDFILSVSEAMKTYLCKEYSVPDDKIMVVPCSVNVEHFASAASNRDTVRKELGIENRFVVTYCGSLAPWQCPDDSLRVFRVIQAIKQNAHFLALTTSPEHMSGLARRAGLTEGEYTVMRVPHQDVPRYMSAGDIGLLLRDRSPVNAVASPVKFAEYLASGLPVVITEGIGDFSSLVARRGLGIVISDIDNERLLRNQLTTFLSDYSAESEAVRSRCFQTATEELSQQVHYRRIEELYKKLV